jgi:hypothetical protein
MKKKILVLSSILALSAVSVFAQENSKSSSKKDLPVAEKNVAVNRGQNEDRTGGRDSYRASFPEAKPARKTGEATNYERRSIYEGTKSGKATPSVGGTIRSSSTGSGTTLRSGNAN